MGNTNKLGVRRFYQLLAALGVIFVIFVLRLFYFQIVEYTRFTELASSDVKVDYAITPARGDFVDRSGNIIASSTTGYNIMLNRAYLKKERTNEIVMRLAAILEQAGEVWNDDTPLSKTAPYTFTKDADGNETQQVKDMKTFFGLNAYATEQNVIAKMVEKYELQNYSEQDVRRLGGIRYEMDVRGYSLSTPFNFAENVKISTVAIVKENSFDLPGVDVEEDSTRYYPDGTVLPHMLGYLGPIYKEEYEALREKGYAMNSIIGKEGLEKLFEEQLRGIAGVKQIVRNKNGDVVSNEVLKPATAGDTVMLTVDLEFQKSVQAILEQQIKTLQAKPQMSGGAANAGALVVIDVKTGEILAMANYPTYDVNLYRSNFYSYSNDKTKPLFNRATQGQYRPGSAFKPVTAIAGLLAGEVNEHSLIQCAGRYMFYADSGFTPGCTGVHGNLSVVRALEVSCNIYFYDLGRRVGIEKINSAAKSFGLGEATGFELPEKTGTLSGPQISADWQGGDVIQAAIGQSNTTVTPLQLAVYGMTIANRGTRYAAHLVKEVYAYGQDPAAQAVAPIVLSTMDAPGLAQAFASVEQGMVRASRYGTAAAFLSNYERTIATKTGTAQVPGGYYDTTMVAYGPVEDPRIAIGLVVEKGANSYNLAQAVRDVFDAYYALGLDSKI